MIKNDSLPVNSERTLSNIIIKTAHVKGAKSLAEGNIKDIVIDVCEQQIERPKKGQKDYYSGKKNDIQ